MVQTGIRPPLRPLRHDQLPTADVLERDAHAVRRREGADAEPGRGEPHHRDGCRGRDRGD